MREIDEKFHHRGEISFKPGLELMSPALEKIKKEIDYFIYLAYSQDFFSYSQSACFL